VAKVQQRPNDEVSYCLPDEALIENLLQIKRYTDGMWDDLIEKARQQAEKAGPSVRVAALLRIARVEAHWDYSRARQTLLEGLDAAQKLSEPARQYLLDEARIVAAAASPELLSVIPATEQDGPPEFSQMGRVHLIQTMLTHGHVVPAFDYLLRQNDPGSFPFLSVGAVLHSIDMKDSEIVARRTRLLNHALELWRRSLSRPDRHAVGFFRDHRHGFEGIFGHFWKDFPFEEALSVAHTIVDRALEEPDFMISSGYPNGVHFTSSRQDDLFQILHVLRHLDPVLAQSLVDSHDQLALATRHYSNGLETLQEEAEAETERLQGEGATCQGGGYFLSAHPADFPRLRSIIDAARRGDFVPSIEDALDQYRQDSSPDAPNYAPKEYWPSTGVYRSTLYQAGQHLGSDAAILLERIPDDDLRLFATIELAAALAGAPASSITSIQHPQPRGSQLSDARITSAHCAIGTSRTRPSAPPMHSPDGRLIRCPKCQFQPSDDIQWACKCGHVWNTFWTAARCPACHFQWEETMCPHCGEMSEHRGWYVPES
jgi:hypothetical protein